MFTNGVALGIPHSRTSPMLRSGQPIQTGLHGFFFFHFVLFCFVFERTRSWIVTDVGEELGRGKNIVKTYHIKFSKNNKNIILESSFYYLKKKLNQFYQAKCFRVVGNMVELTGSMSMSSLSHFLGCEVSSLVRNNTAWNSTMVGKTFYKSTNRSFDRKATNRRRK